MIPPLLPTLPAVPPTAAPEGQVDSAAAAGTEFSEALGALLEEAVAGGEGAPALALPTEVQTSQGEAAPAEAAALSGWPEPVSASPPALTARLLAALAPSSCSETAPAAARQPAGGPAPAPLAASPAGVAAPAPLAPPPAEAAGEGEDRREATEAPEEAKLPAFAAFPLCSPPVPPAPPPALGGETSEAPQAQVAPPADGAGEARPVGTDLPATAPPLEGLPAPAAPRPQPASPPPAPLGSAAAAEAAPAGAGPVSPDPRRPAPAAPGSLPDPGLSSSPPAEASRTPPAPRSEREVPPLAPEAAPAAQRAAEVAARPGGVVDRPEPRGGEARVTTPAVENPPRESAAPAQPQAAAPPPAPSGGSADWTGRGEEGPPGEQEGSAHSNRPQEGARFAVAETASAAAGESRPAPRAPAAAPDPPARLLEEGVGRVVRAVRLSSLDHGLEVQVRLHPEHLGDIRVRVRWEDGVLTAHLQAGSAAAREALEAGLPTLRSSLQEQGVSVDRLQVELRGGSQDRPASHGGEGRPDQPPTPSEPAGASDPEPAPAEAPAAIGRLDLRI